MAVCGSFQRSRRMSWLVERPIEVESEPPQGATRYKRSGLRVARR